MIKPCQSNLELSSYLMFDMPQEESGYTLFWDKAASILFKPKEFSVWAGITGHGKSLFLSQAILAFMQQGAKVCFANLKLKPEVFLSRMYSQITAQKQPDKESFNTASDWLKNKLFIFDFVSTRKVDRLLEVFLYAKRRYGIDVFVIDTLAQLPLYSHAEEKTFIARLHDFKEQNNCHIHLITHSKYLAEFNEYILPDMIKEDPPPHMSDIKGPKMITDLAENCFSIWKNKAKKQIIHKQEDAIALTMDELEKINTPDGLLICHKLGNKTLYNDLEFPFWFDRESLQHLESENHKPQPFGSHPYQGKIN